MDNRRTKRFEELSDKVRKQLESMEGAEVNDYQRQLLDFINENVPVIHGPEGASHPPDLIDKALEAGSRLKQGDATQLLRKIFGSGDDL